MSFPLIKYLLIYKKERKIMVKSEQRLMYEQRVYYAQDYICKHIGEELSLEKLSGIAAFSPYHFHRIFRSISRETLYDFIQRVRIDKSCIMLSATPNEKIINIAMDCGFSTPSAFSKAFKQHKTISPSNYRKKSILQNSKNGTHKSKEGKEAVTPLGYITDRDLEVLYQRRKEMNVKIEDLPKYRIAYMRQIGPYGPGNIEVMQKLKRWAITRDLLDESSQILGIAHDDPEVTLADKCRYDACIILPFEYELEKNVNETTLPGGKYAMFSVEHSAFAIGKLWEEIFAVWLPDSGYQIDDRHIFERYTGSFDVTTLEPKSCEICIPVKVL